MTKVDKILYATSMEKENNKTWIFNYYITKSQKGSYTYMGIMITSRSGSKYYENSISGIFPYLHDAENFLKFMYENQASPISMPYLAAEYIENNFLSDNLRELLI